MIRLISLLLLSSAWAEAADGSQMKGTLYKLGSKRQVKLYGWEMHLCGEVWTSTYFNLDGTIAVEDRVVYRDGKLAEYSYVRHRIDERSSVKVQGNQLSFSSRMKDQSKTETRRTSGVFLSGPAVFPYIAAHLGELQAGKELEFKYGVLDMLDYFSFKLSHQSKTDSESIRVEIKATSLFVRLAIAPITVTLSRDGKFKGIAGRSILMETDGAKFIPIDADLMVESESPISCNSAAE